MAERSRDWTRFKAESPVVVRSTEEDDDPLIERIRGRDHGVHQRTSDPPTLMFGRDAEWTQPEHWDRVVDVGSAAYDVPDNQTVHDRDD